MNSSPHVILSPIEYVSLPKDRHELFLAGSIDMGKARDWQGEVIQELRTHLDEERLRIYNPRRLDWNTEWSQDGAHPELTRQIQWELAALERADTILFYFEPGSLSPITLMELGLHVRSGKCIIYCPTGYWRRSNVMETAEKYEASTVSSLQAGIARIIENIHQ